MEWKNAKGCVSTTLDKIQGLVKFSYFVSLQTTHHSYSRFNTLLSTKKMSLSDMQL